MKQHYVGTKIIQAWEQPRDEVDGYAVVYPDGYTSWSPKEAFELAYIPLGDLDGVLGYLQRLHAEQAQLTQRLVKLDSFLPTEAFARLPREERALLIQQARCMREYHDVLQVRLNNAQSEEIYG